MDRIGLDVILAAVVAVWFVATGLAELLSRPPAAGRRAVSTSPGPPVLRWIRGGLAVLGGLAVAAGAVIETLRPTYPFPGRALGLGLAALALWSAAEAARPPIRWLRLALAAIGVILAVFYAGFRA